MDFLLVVGFIVVVALIAHFTKKGDSVKVDITPAVKSSSAPSSAELKKMTKQQLLDFAEKKSLKVKKSGTKAEVVKAISSQLK